MLNGIRPVISNSALNSGKRLSPGSAIIHLFSQIGQVKYALLSCTLGLAYGCIIPSDMKGTPLYEYLVCRGKKKTLEKLAEKEFSSVSGILKKAAEKYLIDNEIEGRSLDEKKKPKK